ncbi:hypothetical protein P7K49_003411 [Saguinus oedipus]|uniref:Uncharacterized protein n=1 Tax=Saguinus oedipus TaxID=9490 RepID=A0ABQ9W4F9_SAGOE|nr:hypothetical protein P7K49_003411 [Saguinus oedipus]
MAEQESARNGARNRGGVQRVEGKLRASVEKGDYYEAHQMYRTLFFRYSRLALAAARRPPPPPPIGRAVSPRAPIGQRRCPSRGLSWSPGPRVAGLRVWPAPCGSGPSRPGPQTPAPRPPTPASASLPIPRVPLRPSPAPSLHLFPPPASLFPRPSPTSPSGPPAGPYIMLHRAP